MEKFNLWEKSRKKKDGGNVSAADGMAEQERQAEAKKLEEYGQLENLIDWLNKKCEDEWTFFAGLKKFVKKSEDGAVEWEGYVGFVVEIKNADDASPNTYRSYAIFGYAYADGDEPECVYKSLLTQRGWQDMFAVNTILTIEDNIVSKDMRCARIGSFGLDIIEGIADCMNCTCINGVARPLDYKC